VVVENMGRRPPIDRARGAPTRYCRSRRARLLSQCASREVGRQIEGRRATLEDGTGTPYYANQSGDYILDRTELAKLGTGDVTRTQRHEGYRRRLTCRRPDLA
jgi:hypothetical protein